MCSKAVCVLQEELTAVFRSRKIRRWCSIEYMMDKGKPGQWLLQKLEIAQTVKLTKIGGGGGS